MIDMTRLIKFLRDWATAVPIISVLILFAMDSFLWRSHPFAAIVGGVAGALLDVFLFAGSLVVAMLFRASWKALLAAILLGALVEFALMNNEFRVMMGREGFDTYSWLLRSLASCVFVTIMAILMRATAKR